MSDASSDKFNDPFAPPATVCEVQCLQCGEEYESWQIEWRAVPGAPFEGAWCCPTPGCCAVGFGFDILPSDGCEDDEDEDDDSDATEFDDFFGESASANAIWPCRSIDLSPFRPVGNQPQAPFDEMGPPASSYDGASDDEIPF